MEKVARNSWMIADAAKRYKVPEELLCAMIEVESGWYTWAARHEPGYKYLVDIKHTLVSPPTETILQQTSFGLLQIMGATARWMGFHEPYLTTLCDPATGLKWGCRYLNYLYKRHANWSDTVSAYNQGWPRRDPASGQYENQQYVDKVMNAIKGYQNEVTAEHRPGSDSDNPHPVQDATDLVGLQNGEEGEEC
jgi:hypothetical protein